MKTLLTLSVGLFIFYSIGADIGQCISKEYISLNDSENIEPLYRGSARYGMVTIESSNPTGFPTDIRYIGILNDINATLIGQNKVIITPIPWVIFGTVFETDKNVSLTMEIFGGVVDPTQSPTRVTGFSKNIVWEW